MTPHPAALYKDRHLFPCCWEHWLLTVHRGPRMSSAVLRNATEASNFPQRWLKASDRALELGSL